jgi:hypothetical protein
MKDILLCIMPRVEPNAPTAGAGVLKAHLIQEGYDATVLDLNIDLYRYLEKLGTAQKHFFDNEVYFSNQPSDPINDDFELFYEEHKDWFLGWIEKFREINPKWIGMSLLSAFSLSASMKMSLLIKEHLPHIKIVWGGTNVQHEGFFAPVQGKMIDAFIKGDAERGIIELLKENWDYPGINNTKVIDEIIPFDLSLPPNYDDIKWDTYETKYFNKPAYITASRGCVRKCTFCNDWQIWPTYRMKSAKKIAEDLDNLKGKYGRNTFLFTDSLLNGNLKIFKETLIELKKVKEKYPDSPFWWSSHMIVRPKSQWPEEVFQLMAESGCAEAVIGVESFSEQVRNHMGKKFTNNDIWYTFEMLHKYKIKNQCLMLIGYATETEEDHQENLRSIDYVYERGWGYAKKGNWDLFRWTFGNSLLLNEKHSLFDIVNTDPSWQWKSAMDWNYKDNDMATRLRRWKESIARVQLWDPEYQPTPTTARTIEITEERLNNPNGPRFWSE